MDFYQLAGIPRPGADIYSIAGIDRPERRGGGRQLSPIQPMTPEEEDSLLTQLSGGALSGLAWIGDTLDKYTGARGVRGAIAGKPRELLSIIPGSDQIGLTNLEDRTTGRDLLGVSEDEAIFSPGGLGAIGLEMVLDPSTYLTFGGSALTRAGMKAAAKNTLKTGAREAIEAGQRGLVGLGIPFTGLRAGAIGTGQTGLKTLDNLGKVADATGLSMVGRGIGNAVAPVGRKLRAMFSPEVMGLTSQAGQTVAPKSFRNLKEYEALVREDALKLLRPMEEAGVDPNQFIRWAEDIRPDKNVFENADAALGGDLTWDELMKIPESERQVLMPRIEEELGMSALPNSQEMDLVRQAQGTLDDWLRTERNLGLAVSENEKYFPRYRTLLEEMSPGFRSLDEGLNPLHQSMRKRQDLFDPLGPDSRQKVNQLAADQEVRDLLGAKSEMKQQRALERMGEDLDPDVMALPPTTRNAGKLIEKKYLGYDSEKVLSTVDKQMRDAAKAMRKAERDAVKQFGNNPEAIAAATKETREHFASWEKFREQMKKRNRTVRSEAARLADWVQKNVDPKYASEKLEFFGNHPATDFIVRGMANAHARANAEAIQDLIHFAAVEAPSVPRPDLVPLREAMKRMGIGSDRVADAAMKSGLEYQGAMRGLFGDDVKHLDNLFVPEEIVRDAARFQQSFKLPETLQTFVDGWDSVNNFTKSFLTALWPAFHVRNAVTGGFMNWVADAFSPQSYMETMKAIKGGVIDSANRIPGLQHLTPQQATQQIHDWAYKYGLTGTGEGFFADLLGLGQHQAQKAKPVLPGSPQKGPVAEYLGGWMDMFTNKEARDITGIAGVGGKRVDTLGPIRGGRKAGALTDEISRFSGFLELLKKGYDPGAAAQKIKNVHYDYTKLAGFEKDVMRRVAPFYNWVRHNVPFVVNQIIEQPGGKMAGSIKIASKLRGEDPGFLPEWLGEGVVMPMGENQDGTTRFLSSLGLPFEDLPNMMSARGIFSNMSPYLKLPLELGTGVQLYTGRQLADLQGMTPSSTLDSIIFNSPLSRFATSYNKLTDPRKGWDALLANLGTGVRLTDVDLERARDLRVRDIIEENMRGRPHVRPFTRQYVSADDYPLLDQTTMDLLRLQRTRDLRARQGVQNSR